MIDFGALAAHRGIYRFIPLSIPILLFFLHSHSANVGIHIARIVFEIGELEWGFPCGVPRGGGAVGLGEVGQGVVR